eukprot:5049372-Pleurochrysis_carterae.AAC.4
MPRRRIARALQLVRSTRARGEARAQVDVVVVVVGCGVGLGVRGGGSGGGGGGDGVGAGVGIGVGGSTLTLASVDFDAKRCAQCLLPYFLMICLAAGLPVSSATFLPLALLALLPTTRSLGGPISLSISLTISLSSRPTARATFLKPPVMPRSNIFLVRVIRAAEEAS